MAVYNGSLVEEPNQINDTWQAMSNTIRGWNTGAVDMPPDEIGVVEPVDKAGSWTDVLPTENRIEWGTPGPVTSFFDDYYYRIHIEPNTFEFGAILNPLEEEFIVWNAWLVSKLCTAINEVNGAEFDWTGLTPSFSLPGLAHTTYTLDIPVEGAVEFEAEMIFVFPDENPSVWMRGIRAQAFPFEPLLPLRESLEWFTDILTSKDGSEQRIAVRYIPRQRFGWKSYLRDEREQAILDSIMFSWMKRAFGVPIWAERVIHTDDIDADDTVIALDTEYADFRDDSFAIIIGQVRS